MERRAQGEPADIKSRSGQLLPRSRRMEQSVYTFFVYRTLTSDNASKAVAKKLLFAALALSALRRLRVHSDLLDGITFERNTFSEIHESKSKKTRFYC